MASIETFSALDIRIGRIVAVEDHEKARKPMYKLTVDLGRELGIRTIVAGIKAYYSREELMNKKIACVVNLDPKIIAGVESRGMLLAAGEEDEISILVPDKDVAEGSRIH
jgi:export-related chaperone CsaA